MNNVAGEWVSDRGSGAERFDGSGITMALRRPHLPWVPAFAGITRRETAMTRAGIAGSP